MPTGLRGSWSEEHPVWRARFEQLFDERDRVPIGVLVWGPGQRSPDYEKRKTIQEHLRSQNTNNDVATSEELMRLDNRFEGMHLYEAEVLHWRAADIVFALITRDDRATGSRGEMAIYSGQREFREKAYVIGPRLARPQLRQLGFLDRGWATFPKERRLNYTDEEYRDCTRIRRYCNSLVEEKRKERWLDNLQYAP